MHKHMHTVSPIKLETGLRPNSAVVLSIEAVGFPSFGLLLYIFQLLEWSRSLGYAN